MSAGRDEARTFPVLYQGSGPHNGPTSVPWAWLARFEGQMLRNHSQSMQRLSERGGLSPTEIWMVVHGHDWSLTSKKIVRPDEAVPWLNSEPWKKPAQQTKVGVTALIIDGDRVLLGRKGRAFAPEFEGKWVTPGGRVDYGEPLVMALIREVHEETGLLVAVGRPLAPREILHADGHYVFFAFAVTPVHGSTPRAGDDLTEVRWCERAALVAMRDSMTDLTRAIVDDYLAAPARPTEAT